MLDSKIHEGLDTREMRDVLGQDVGECWDAGDPEFIREDIVRREKTRERAKKKHALMA